MSNHHHITDEADLDSYIAQYVQQHSGIYLNDEYHENTAAEFLERTGLCPYSILKTYGVYSPVGDKSVRTEAIDFLGAKIHSYIYETHTKQLLQNIEGGDELLHNNSEEPEIATKAEHITPEWAIYGFDFADSEYYIYFTLDELTLAHSDDHDYDSADFVLEDHPVETLGVEQQWISFSGEELKHQSVDSDLPLIEYIYTPERLMEPDEVSDFIGGES